MTGSDSRGKQILVTGMTRNVTNMATMAHGQYTGKYEVFGENVQGECARGNIQDHAMHLKNALLL